MFIADITRSIKVSVTMVNVTKNINLEHIIYYFFKREFIAINRRIFEQIEKEFFSKLCITLSHFFNHKQGSVEDITLCSRCSVVFGQSIKNGF